MVYNTHVYNKKPITTMSIKTEFPDFKHKRQNVLHRIQTIINMTHYGNNPEQ